MPSLKELLQTDEVLKVFAVSRIMHPVVLDVYGLVGGFHGFWIDQEHGGVTYEQVAMAALCGRAHGLDCFVRMAMTGYSQATQNLEAGAGGLMAARVESAEQAREFVNWVKFAPLGNRGINLGGRDALYGGMTLPQFAEESNRQSLAIVQIETLGALAEADEIAALDGVDMLFVGPSDLSLELGVLGQIEHQKLWDAYEKVDQACRRHGKHWSTIAVTPQFARRAADLGCRMLSFGADVVTFRKGVEAMKNSFGEFFGS